MRSDFSIIQSYIADGSCILDLGCGDGTLLTTLAQHKRISGYGLEINSDRITACIAKGVNVIEQNIDTGLANFADNSFDLVIMTHTLQAMKRPDITLEEMLRVGKECVVTFPNFGHWNARFYLFFRGRMPVSDIMPYEWYDTPNIHFCTVRDFEYFCQQNSITILHRDVISSGSIDGLLKKIQPNIFGETAIYHLTR
ncbi:MAG: methionine biosynthesis protein MetW [Gammaproteobacteria bacterium]|nr:methionine biosynthesis protein MetW [Gammaproteobacteria bacterium]